ncbi:MAG: hypothetical protein KIT25_12865 [Enhydrobacter sp.]|nr:MAG: hypothetical protein KIT25_12865 [Enhydrobacter sp.]
MIARLWRGRATLENAGRYVAHFDETVVPELQRLDGYRDGWLLRREHDAGMEFLAVTLWQSRDAIRAFAGDDIAKAHVEREARAVLSDFDEFATHYDVVPRAWTPRRIDRPA